MSNKAFHLTVTIKQNNKIVSFVTRVYNSMYDATEAIRQLNNMFHETLLKVELNVLEIKDD